MKTARVMPFVNIVRQECHTIAIRAAIPPSTPKLHEVRSEVLHYDRAAHRHRLLPTPMHFSYFHPCSLQIEFCASLQYVWASVLRMTTSGI